MTNHIKTANIAALIAVALTLGSCGSSHKAAPAHVVIPRMAIYVAQQFLMGEQIALPEARPGALLGIHTALFLERENIVAVAAPQSGIEAQMTLRSFGGSGEEKYTLLQDLSSAIGVDLQAMLSGSDNRKTALETYIASLEGILQQSDTEHAILEQELSDVQAERKAKRDTLNGLQRALRDALRDEDYATAGSLQEQVVTSQSDVATVEAREDELRSNIRLYEDLLEIGKTRLAAINANKDVLISGQMVINVPGIEDIGVLKQSGSGARNRLFSPLGGL